MRKILIHNAEMLTRVQIDSEIFWIIQLAFRVCRKSQRRSNMIEKNIHDKIEKKKYS